MTSNNVHPLPLDAERQASAMARASALASCRIADAISAALKDDRRRCIELLKIATQVERMNASFDLAEAIMSGVSANDARAFVFEQL
ncbi:hypothetical protein C8J37_1126 [Rhizobium sp. PP-WC-1G-195]|nr:hypothetical protein C8J37_1126 [Rhizobium sp. PP-WC-1G-195]